MWISFLVLLAGGHPHRRLLHRGQGRGAAVQSPGLRGHSLRMGCGGHDSLRPPASRPAKDPGGLAAAPRQPGVQRAAQPGGLPPGADRHAADPGEPRCGVAGELGHLRGDPGLAHWGIPSGDSASPRRLSSPPASSCWPWRCRDSTRTGGGASTAADGPHGASRNGKPADLSAGGFSMATPPLPTSGTSRNLRA